MKKIIFLLFLILPIKYSVASCTNGQADSTCISATPMTYNNTSNTPNTPQTYNSTSNITNTSQIQQCTNSSAGYYQNTQSPGGCLYKAPPQCSAGQTQTSAPYWDTLNDTWNGLQCQNPPPPQQQQNSGDVWQFVGFGSFLAGLRASLYVSLPPNTKLTNQLYKQGRHMLCPGGNPNPTYTGTPVNPPADKSSYYYQTPTGPIPRGCCNADIPGGCG